MIKFFQSFLGLMRSRFQRIVRAAKYDMMVDDLHSDAWVIALDIGDRRGHPIDFSDPADQELVMAALYVEKVKRGDWKMRHAVRIDHAPDANEDGPTLAERLPAAASSDPFVSLLMNESAADVEAMLAASYSQASAYVVTFRNFRQDLERVRAHLVLSKSGFNRRLSFARRTVEAQPSVFDRIERVEPNFMPMPGKAYIAADVNSRVPETAQHTFSF